MPVSFADNSISKSITPKKRPRSPSPSPVNGKRGINSRNGPAGHHNKGSRKKQRTHGGNKSRSRR